MKLRALRRLKLVSRIVIAASLAVIVVVEYALPFVVDQYYADEYRKLVAECDEAMHEEAALRPRTAGAAKDPVLSISAEVGLSVCHEYDKLRKRLLTLGVTEERLALHGLEALEIEQIPVSRMVNPHRIERF